MSGRRGNITRRGEKSWRLKFDLPPDPKTGERRTQYCTFRGTKKEANIELARLITAAEEGTFVAPSKLTVGEYLDKWLDTYARPRLSAKTTERFAEIVELHLKPALGKSMLKSLSPLDVQSYYNKALETGRLDGKGGLSPKTILQHHRVLSQALKQAVSWRLISVSPVAGVKPPKVERADIGVLDRDELGKLLKAAHGTELFYPVMLTASTGLRRGELLALRWSDIDLDSDSDKGTLTVARSLEQTREGLRFKEPKTKTSRRTIRLPAKTVELLKRHRKEQERFRLSIQLGRDVTDADVQIVAFKRDDGLVFCDHEGAPVPPMRITKNFQSLVKRADVKRITFHALRHTHITHLLQDGVDVKTVSARAGHSSATITLDLYGHVLEAMEERAAQATDASLRAALED